MKSNNMQQPIYVALCSFGKDSIATILLALEHGESEVARPIFAPMASSGARPWTRWKG